ncbi:MAG: squalene/phytoene synthase family protein [Bdellovibrionales bacterium]|nr:squalene/phytoene synthase family protein [Bdellovibrionales bacterium]
MHESVRAEFVELLGHTSRSFSLGIKGLAQPLRDEVTLGYLLCRVLDTYEDTLVIPADLRLQCLQRSRDILLAIDEPSRAEALLAHWADWHEFGGRWTESAHPDPWEHRLLRAGERMWREILLLSVNVRRSFRESLLDMIDGMANEVQRRQLELDPQPRTLAQTDEYCYAVAGTVGILLTGLFREQGAFANISDAQSLRRDSIEFGKALQLVNIMKDFHKDWVEGRCYWPGIPLPLARNTALPANVDLEKIFSELRNCFAGYLVSARRYIAQLGEARRDLTFFCAFPLKMAEATLERAAADMSWLREGGTFKVSRLEVAQILASLVV